MGRTKAAGREPLPNELLDIEALSVATVSRVLKTARSSTYAMIRSGALPSLRLSEGRVRVLRSDLERFVAERRS